LLKGFFLGFNRSYAIEAFNEYFEEIKDKRKKEKKFIKKWKIDH